MIKTVLAIGSLVAEFSILILRSFCANMIECEHARITNNTMSFFIEVV